MALLKRSDVPSLFSNSLLSDFFFDDDRFFNLPWARRQSMPAVNIRESDQSYEIDFAAPGLTKKDFKIDVNNGILTVSAEKEAEKETKEDSYTRREFEYTSFSRSFNLPENVKDEDINARYEDGILKLTIPKKELKANKPKKAIEVK